jgi:hypothetical protein
MCGRSGHVRIFQVQSRWNCDGSRTCAKGDDERLKSGGPTTKKRSLDDSQYLLLATMEAGNAYLDV